jgi:thiol-disulfide isomerase/thioredoxin
MKRFLIGLSVLIAGLAIAIQDKPQDISKKDLPKAAECVVCISNGGEHGMEKPAAGVMYKGKEYYFCNGKEVAEFKNDPEAYMPPIIPRHAPEFGLKDESGKVWDAEAMKGKLVLVDYWATYCVPCKKMFPILDKLYAKYKDAGLEILSVTVDPKRADLDKYLKSRKFPNPVVHDTVGNFGKWGVRVIPATFLVKDGKIVTQWRGEIKEKDLAAAIEANLK